MYRIERLFTILFKAGISILFIFLASSCIFKKEQRSVSNDERDYYLSYLKENLHKNKYQTSCISIAEYLTDLQYGQDVYDFLSEIDLTSDSINSSYKCGIYRVLALSSQNQENREKWIKKINEISESGNDSVRFLMATALVQNGKVEDVSQLKNAFSKELEVGGNNDVTFALAYAILKIDRNEPYNLSNLDWVVVAAYFVMMVLIGVYYSKKNKIGRASCRERV